MYLIVDFESFDLEYEITDICLDEYNAEYTVGKLITELCHGIEKFGNCQISQKSTVRLRHPNGQLIDSTHMVADLGLNDWDTIYLVKGR